MKPKTHIIVVEMQVEAISRKDAHEQVFKWIKERDTQLLGDTYICKNSKQAIIEDEDFN